MPGVCGARPALFSVCRGRTRRQAVRIDAVSETLSTTLKEIAPTASSEPGSGLGSGPRTWRRQPRGKAVWKEAVSKEAASKKAASKEAASKEAVSKKVASNEAASKQAALHYFVSGGRS